MDHESHLIDNTEIELPDSLLGDAEEDPEQKAINQFLAAVGSSGNATISVWEQESTHKAPLKFLFKCGAGDYDYDGLIEYVMINYGGGTYRMQIRLDGKLRVNHTFAIAGEKKKPVVAAVIQNAPVSDNSDIKILIMEMQRSNQDMIKELLAERSNNDPFDLLTKIMALKDVLFGQQLKPVDPMEQFSKSLEMVDKIKAIGGSGDGDTGSQITSILRQYLPDIIEVTKKALDRPVVQNPLTQRAQIGNNVMRFQQTEIKPVNPIHAALKPHILTLTIIASNNEPVGKWASKVVDMTPDDQLDNLFDFVNDTQYMNVLIEMHPPVNTYKEWFERLRTALVNELTVDQTENRGDTTLDSDETAQEDHLAPIKFDPDHVATHDDTGRTAGDVINLEGYAEHHEDR